MAVDDFSKRLQDIGAPGKEVPLATIKGQVLGHDGENYTRGINGAYAVLAVRWIDKAGQHTHEVTEQGMKDLKEAWPMLHDFLAKYAPRFAPQQTKGDGNFEFKDIPISEDWGYIINAYHDDKEKKPASHTDEMGNDGKGKRQVIRIDSEDKGNIRDGVVVPVKDKYIEENIPEPAKGPKWDKKLFEPGAKR